VTANAGAGQYIYYCVPTSFSNVTFKVGGWEGGIQTVATVYYTNGSYTTSYRIYRTDKPNLGQTTIIIN
jgi:hypothetical protein